MKSACAIYARLASHTSWRIHKGTFTWSDGLILFREPFRAPFKQFVISDHSYQMEEKFSVLNFKDGHDGSCQLYENIAISNMKNLHFCVPQGPPWKLDKMNEEVKWDVFWD